MKRDNDYIRELLFEFEGNDSYLKIVPWMYGMSDEQEKEHYHVQLLCDAGYIVKSLDTKYSGYRLTSQGHDFIEAIRDKGIWEKTKKKIADIGGNVTLDMVKTIAIGFLEQTIRTS